MSIAIALVLLPPVARADSGGATINTLPDSFQLEGQVEVQHQCPGGGSLATCYWFGEAAQYPASTECPDVFDITHSVWVGSEEESSDASNGTFAFTPEATIVRLCLYIYVEGSNLVGESHPFNTQTGSEVLPQSPAEPSLHPARITLQLKVHGCKITTNWLVNGSNYAVGGNVTWALYRQARHNTFKRVAGSTVPEKDTFLIEASPGTYRFSARFLGDSNLLPSQEASAAVFHIKRCPK